MLMVMMIRWRRIGIGDGFEGLKFGDSFDWWRRGRREEKVELVMGSNGSLVSCVVVRWDVFDVG